MKIHMVDGTVIEVECKGSDIVEGALRCFSNNLMTNVCAQFAKGQWSYTLSPEDE